jgi:DNA-binding GntR family transcriptional regulator
MKPRPLHRLSTVDALAEALRTEILDGALPPGARLRERELGEAYGVARHSLRAALRALAGEGLVRIEPHRGARVAQLTTDDVRWLYELRAALELEAAHLALQRNGGRLPPTVHQALARLEAACRGTDPPWSAVNEAHAELHGAIVAAAHSPRIAAAHAALSGEMRLFLLALKPHVAPERVAADHVALVRGLEREGPGVLREHLRTAAETLTGADPGGNEGGRPDG